MVLIVMVNILKGPLRPLVPACSKIGALFCIEDRK